MTFSYKTKTSQIDKHRDLVVTRFEFCDIMEGSNVNGFIKMWLDIFTSTIPSFFHKCPYVKQTFNLNLTFLEDDFQLFPAGFYETTLNFSSGRKEYFSVQYLPKLFIWQAEVWWLCLKKFVRNWRRWYREIKKSFLRLWFRVNSLQLYSCKYTETQWIGAIYSIKISKAINAEDGSWKATIISH